MDTLAIIKDYIADIDKLYQTGITTEHSFRPALQRLMEQCTGFRVVNEQRHIDCGAPDMTLLKSNMAVCYIECKDLEDGDLDGRIVTQSGNQTIVYNIGGDFNIDTYIEHK